MRPNNRTIECFPSPYVYHHIKGLFTAITFTDNKITRHIKRQKTQFKETEQASESHMAGILELREREFKIPRINMLWAIMDNVNSMQKQMSNLSKEMKMLRKKPKEMLKLKKNEREIKHAFARLISRLETAEERIFGLSLYQ